MSSLAASRDSKRIAPARARAPPRGLVVVGPRDRRPPARARVASTAAPPASLRLARALPREEASCRRDGRTRAILVAKPSQAAAGRLPARTPAHREHELCPGSR